MRQTICQNAEKSSAGYQAVGAHPRTVGHVVNQFDKHNQTTQGGRERG
jgi:hypothetical protein